MNYKLLNKMFLVIYIFALFIGVGLVGLFNGFNTNKNTSGDNIRIVVPKGKVSASPIPDEAKGYTANMGLRETLATFEYGLDAPYDRIFSDAPHFWEKLTTAYSDGYTPITVSGDTFNSISTTELKNGDNSNFWYVLPDSAGKKDGSCDAVYKLNAPRQTNYQNFAPYNELRLIWKGSNPNSSKVNIAVSLYNPSNKKWYSIGEFSGVSNKKYELAFDLRCISQIDRSIISKIKFTTKNTDIGSNAGGKSYQRNDLFYIDVWSDTTIKKDITVNNLNMATEYLGNVLQSQWGAYSASGFYDKQDKKWKVWYGCGVPETIASDNVFYIETTDPQKGWSFPVRIIPDDPHGILQVSNKSPGYGGDPSVIKIKGVYYMYISGLVRNPTNGNFNQIFLLTSSDGIQFKVVDKPVVPAADGGALGYGSGGPSVVYKDGTFYLYYYSQFDKPGGLMLRTSKDGYNFSDAQKVFFTALDVKYIDSIKKWVGCYYNEQNYETNPQSSATRIAVSDDGIHWVSGSEDSEMPAQDFSAVTNHNPGFIGTEDGHGYETMFLTYGDNDMALSQGSVELAGMQMDTRQLFWSRITIKP